MLIVQVAPEASVAPQVVPVKLNRLSAMPATVTPVIVTAVGAVATVPVFVIDRQQRDQDTAGLQDSSNP